MRKHLLAPTVAVAGGVVGFALRKWQLATAFEPDTGLPIPGAPAALVLMALTAAVALALILLCRGCTNDRPFDEAFAAQGNTVYLTACVLAAFLLLASAAAEVIILPTSFQTARATGTWLAMVLPPLRAATCVVGFFCALVTAKGLYRAEGKGKESLPLLGLCFLFCVWLISDYQRRAADPVLQNYVYGVLAIVAALLGLYYMAGFSFQTGQPRRTAVAALLGTYLSLVALADRHALADLARYGFAILFLTAHAALLLREHPAGTVPAETEDIDHA